MKSLLPKTLLDMKRKLWSIPDNRDDVVYDDMEFGWITDFDNVDSVANVALRKTDLLNFAIFNEGNLYNNLFYKVLMYCVTLITSLLCQG